jgi:hypothetical protein
MKAREQVENARPTSFETRFFEALLGMRGNSE